LTEKNKSLLIYLLIVYHVFTAFFGASPPFPLHLVMVSVLPALAQNQMLVIEANIFIQLIIVALHMLAGFGLFMYNKWGWFLSILLSAFWIMISLVSIILLSPSLDILTYVWTFINFVVAATLCYPSLRTAFKIH